MKKSLHFFTFLVIMALSSGIMASDRPLSAYDQRRQASLTMIANRKARENLRMSKQQPTRENNLDRAVQSIIEEIRSNSSAYQQCIVPAFSPTEPHQIRKIISKKEKDKQEIEIKALRNAIIIQNLYDQESINNKPSNINTDLPATKLFSFTSPTSITQNFNL